MLAEDFEPNRLTVAKNAPLTAASMAEVLGVRVYTVALGTKAEPTLGCCYDTDNVDALYMIMSDIALAEEMGNYLEAGRPLAEPMSREEVDRLLDAAASREEVVQMKVRVASGI